MQQAVALAAVVLARVKTSADTIQPVSGRGNDCPIMKDLAPNGGTLLRVVGVEDSRWVVRRKRLKSLLGICNDTHNV